MLYLCLNLMKGPTWQVTGTYYCPIDVSMVRGRAAFQYIMEIGMGNPPQNKKLLLDTGSSLLWVNCKDCKNCKTENQTLGIHITPYDPKQSKTSKIVNYSKDGCWKNLQGKCGFSYGYGDGKRALTGYMVEDNIMIGNQKNGHVITANVKFGCVTEQMYDANSDGNDFLGLGIDGIIGFGNQEYAILNQLSSLGVSTPEISQCFDNINGGGIFVIGHLLEPKMTLNDQVEDDYLLDLLGMDFGGERIKLNATPIALFDSGSDRLYAPESAVNDIASKLGNLLAMKNATTKVQVGGSNCFKLPGRNLSYDLVDQEFPSISLYFDKAQELKISPRNYIRPNEDENFKDYWCLYVDKLLPMQDERDMFILGGSVMSQKLIVYDSLNHKLGFTNHDCSSKIKVEGGGGKPIFIGGH